MKGERKTPSQAQTRPLALMIKPSGSACNMRCDYCYYRKTDIDAKAQRMSVEMLEKMIRDYVEASAGPVLSFTWHGGEPVTAGLDFYREAVRLQKKYLPEGWECWNSLQTNGYALDDEWCDFLAENHFDVGLSIDGTQSLHDRFRHDGKGEGTWQRVKESAQRLLARGIKPDLLCTVTEETAQHGREVYESLKAFETGWMQFIPIVMTEEKAGKREPVYPSVTPRSYGNFLKEVFSRWFYHDMGRTEVQFFSETALVLAGGEASLCTMRESCGQVPVIERDGGVYACDHFVRREYKTGDLGEESLLQIIRREQAKAREGGEKSFGEAKHEELPERCKSCGYLSLCNGGCLKDRFVEQEGDYPLYYLCEGLRSFFDYALPRLKQAMTLSAAHVPPDEIMARLVAQEREKYRKVSRNDPCPCGSGLKYKNCCSRLVP